MKRLSLAIAIASTLLVAGQPSYAQPLPAFAPNALANALRTDGIDPAIGFRMSRPMNCIAGSSKNDWAYHCVATLTDTTHRNRTVALEIMIFNGGYDFAARDAQIKASVVRRGGRWSLDTQPDVSLKGETMKISLQASCHQSRGQTNSPAYTLLPVARNVLIFTQVPLAEASSDRVTTSPNGADSFDDIGHAGSLASMGLVAIAKFQKAQLQGKKRN